MQAVGVIGIPFDEKSSFLRGSAKGPAAIRQALHDGSSNYGTEGSMVLEEGVHYRDFGDLDVTQYPDDIRDGVLSALTEVSNVICLGGDHSVAYPIVQATHSRHREFHILQLDAHTDLYDEFEGDRFSHACPFARIMEENLAASLTQVGVRVVSDEQRKQQIRFGVDLISMRDWFAGKRPEIRGPLYVSLDLDVFDPAHAPGISHFEPGGMNPREVLELILNLDVPIIGADIVEYNPDRDHHGMTAMLGAKLLKELTAKIIQTRLP